MKCKTTLFLATLCLSFGAFSYLGTKAYQNSIIADEVQAATTVNEYYNSVNTSSATSLFNSLRTIINAGANIGSYSQLWTSYKTTDVDSSGKIVDIYSNTTSFTPGTDQCGTYRVEGDCYNREHTIPKSWWGGAESNQGADLFIVYPSDGKVNGMRSNYPFGEVSSASYTSNNSYSRLGSSVYSTSASKVFEPNDEWKGDMARVYFYAVTKWSGSSGWTSGEGSTIFTSNANSFYLTDYAKNLFIKWHLEDPVSGWELSRNSKVYNIQGNRNPYIDHPEYVTQIWGTSDWYEGEVPPVTEPDPLENLVMSQTTATIEVGQTLSLSVTPIPSTASKSVTWSSSNSSIASVSSIGVVTAKQAGTVTITATSTTDASISCSCFITINEKTTQATSSEAITYSSTGLGTSGSYTTWTYNSDSGSTFVGHSYPNSTGYIQLRTSGSKSGIVMTSSSGIVDSISVEWNSSTTSGRTLNVYGKNEAYSDPSDLYNTSTQGTLLGTIVCGTSTELVTSGEYSFIGVRSNSGALYLDSLTIYYREASAPEEITSISASVSKHYYVGETISSSDITVKDNNGNQVNDFVFSQDGYQFTYEDAAGGGVISTKNFVVSYNDLEATFSVNVSRQAYVTPVAETISLSSTEFKNSTVSKFSSTPSDANVTIGGIDFTVTTNAYIYNSKYLSFGKNVGSIQNTNAFEKDIESISITTNTSNTRTDGVTYISKDGSSWIEYSESLCAEGGYRYFKHAYETTSSSYSNIASIVITVSGSETATNVANYIMYEDTINQCTTKFDVAVSYFNNMSSSERTTFMTSNDYVISCARERLEAWATNQGKQIVYSNGDYLVQNALNSNLEFEKTIAKTNIFALIICLCFAGLLTAITIVTHKRKRNTK